MAPRPQTAIRGVFSVAIVNVLARIVGYGKHVLIAAYIGLSAGLDAYFVAVTAMSIFILTFGDVFDSLGIPRLVRTLHEEGEEAFRRLAGSVLILACILSTALCLLLLTISPWTPWIAPGFSPDKKALVLRNLYYLAPMAILYLPYHAMGSILRARRRFVDFYIVELFNTILTVAVLYAGRNFPFIVPIAASAGYAAGSVYVAVVTRGEIRLSGADGRDIRELLRLLFALLPLYLASYLPPLVDRAFASYLPTGAVSALSYGLLIVLIPSSILMMENIFITPLSEDVDRGTLMGRILCGILVISVPVAVFTCAYSDLIVQAGLERGVFTRSSTAMTAEALSFLAPAIPAFLLWPICYRLFQVVEKLRSIGIVTGAGILVHVSLNFVFMRLGLGIKGLALATTIASYAVVAGAALLMRKSDITFLSRKAFNVLLIAIVVSGLSFGISRAIPLPAEGAALLLSRGAFFVVLVSALYLCIPNEEIRNWRRTVANEIVPKWFAR